MKNLIRFIFVLLVICNLPFDGFAQKTRGGGSGGAAADTTGGSVFPDTIFVDYISSRTGGTLEIIADVTVTARSTVSLVLTGKIDADYTEATATADGTRYYDFLVDVTVDPAASAEVNAGYYRINKTGGSNGVYILNGLEGVAGSSYADEAGTFRGGLFRTYTDPNTVAGATMRTAIGMEASARASYSGGVEAVAEGGTASVGARIWMAPYFTAGSLSNINNFHGLWLYNEHTSNTVTNAIFVDDAGGTGGWTNGLNLNGATIGVAEIVGSNNEIISNINNGSWRLSADASLIDYADFAIAADGLLTITTVDADAAEADIALMPDGNVGIGIVSPQELLEVHNPSSNAIQYISTDLDAVGNYAGIFFETDRAGSPSFGEIGLTKGVTGGTKLVLGISGNIGSGSDFVITSAGVGINTNSPAEMLHLDGAGGTDGTGSWTTNASVSTTDASATTIYTLGTGTNLAYRILVDVIGAQDDGSNSMGSLHSFTIKNVAGTVTEQGDVSIQETDDSAGVSVSGAVSGTDYLIQVTGINPENWNWEATIRATVVAH